MTILLLLFTSFVSPAILLIMNKRIKETHKQVTENHHSSETPTILDLLDLIREDGRETHAMLIDHIQWHGKKE